MTVRVEVVTPCEHGKEGHMVELDTGGFRPCPSGASRRSFTEWPPEAIEAGVRGYFGYEDDTEWEQDVALAMADPAAVRFVRGLAAALGHITGDNK